MAKDDFKVGPQISLEISVGSKLDLRELGISAFTCERSVNQVPLFKLTLKEICSLADAKADKAFSGIEKFPLGEKIVVKAGIDTPKEIWKGLVTGHKITRTDQNFLTILGHGDVIKMTEGVRNQIFEKDDTDKEIITEITKDVEMGDIADSEIIHTQRYFAYQQTPWRIMMNRVLANGFIFIPGIDKNHVKKVAELPGNKVTYKMFDENCYESLEKFTLGSDITSDIEKVTSTAWDIKEQEMKEASKGAASLTGKHSFKFDPGLLNKTLDMRESAPITAIESTVRASAQLIYRGLDVLQGKISFMLTYKSQETTKADIIDLGDTIELSQLGKVYNGDYLVTGIKNDFVSGKGWRVTLTLGLPLNYTLFSDWLKAPPVPNLIGKVKDFKDDPDNIERIPIWLPEITDDPDKLVWARLTTPFATKQAGVYFQPETDDEVLVGFSGGISSYPFIIGSTHNPKNPPPMKYTKPIEKRGIFYSLFKEDGEASTLESSYISWEKTKDLVRLQGGKNTSIDLDTAKGLVLDWHKDTTSKSSITIKEEVIESICKETKVKVSDAVSMDVKAAVEIVAVKPVSITAKVNIEGKTSIT